jgi:ubiquinone/menaquinone biosynthesis C-methylase UbiE
LWVLSILKQKPKSVEAIDFSQEAIKICKNNSNFKSVNLTKGNVLHMPYESASFDVVVCYYILNNLIQKDRLKAVKQIKELKKLCDKVVVLEPMATTSTSAKIRLLQIGAAKKISATLSEKLIKTVEDVLQELKGEK